MLRDLTDRRSWVGERRNLTDDPGYQAASRALIPARLADPQRLSELHRLLQFHP